MNFLTDTFNFILYRPLFNFLVLLYLYLPGHDFGMAIIIFTVLIKIILSPLNLKTIYSQKLLQEIQPKLQEIQEKYKDNKERQIKETLEFYKKEKINPFSGCFSLLIQLPILIALYRVFKYGLNLEEMHFLYDFIPEPGEINPLFLGVINLSKPNIFLAISAGIFQFFQSKIGFFPEKKIKPGKKFQTNEMIQKTMFYFFPISTVLILTSLPSAVGLFWSVSSLFSIFQQRSIQKKYHNSIERT